MITRGLFFFVLAIEIYFSSTHQTLGMQLTKPLLMPILMLLAFQLKIKDKALYFALFFSLLGDVFLMFSGEKFFMLGLGSFLLAHVFYILLFKTEFKFQPLKTLPFVITTSAYFLIIKPGIDQNLILPVLAYCVVITLMGIFASNRITNRTSYITVLIGSILFVISDSLIAFNKFYAPLPMSTIWIMSTYGIAQYLIVTGWAAKRY
jgi:uncharacterized membrane protein YhhN